MGAFLGAIGLVIGIIGGLIWTIVALIRHKNKRNPLILLVVGVILTGIGFSATPTSKSNVPSNSEAKADMAAIAQEKIRKYESKDVKVEMDNVHLKKQPDQVNVSNNKKYNNVYYLWGDYTYQDHLYSFNMRFNWNKVDIRADDAKYQIINYNVGNSSYNFETKTKSAQ